MELKLTWFMLIVTLLTSNNCVANPIAIANQVSTDSEAEMFLVEYGYLNPNKLPNKNSYQTALLEYQTFFGLNKTGTFTDETKSTMNEPRCGNPEKLRDSTSRKKRYTIQRHTGRYPKSLINYKITKYTSKLRNEEVDQWISRAFQVWSNQTGIIFKHARNGEPTNINIRFETGFHWDGIANRFDGPLGKLAHAALPNTGHSIHFDEDEFWTFNTGEGVNFFQVAIHEIGHKLGLSHTDVKSAAMFPKFYYQRDFKLDPDDIAGIKRLYTKKKT